MPQLRVKNGPQKGKIVQIEGNEPVILGRDPDTHLQIIDKGVSRAHAEVFRVGEMVFIRDRGSRNGTFVNGEQMEEELLREGDVIRVGTTQLVFESTKSNRERGKTLQFEEGDDFRTSLELKVDDLFVSESASTGREREHFRAVCQATQLLLAEKDQKALFNRLMDLIQEYIPADHLYLFLRDPLTGALLPQATRQSESNRTIPISRTILDRVIKESHAILTADAMQDERFKTGDSIVINQIRSVLCVPLQGSAQAQGAIYAVNARLAETFDESDLQLLMVIGAQVANRIEALRRSNERDNLLANLLSRLMALLERQTAGQFHHAERVSRYAVAIATEMGQAEGEIQNLRLAGLLHDIGRLKETATTAQSTSESGIRALNVATAEEIFHGLPDVENILASIRSQHERYDGKGDPHGLKGEKIPLGGRILAVANRFDHLMYEVLAEQKGKGPHDGSLIRKAFTALTEEAGEALDTAVVRALIVAHRHGRIFPDSDKKGAYVTGESAQKEELEELEVLDAEDTMGETFTPQQAQALRRQTGRTPTTKTTSTAKPATTVQDVQPPKPD